MPVFVVCHDIHLSCLLATPGESEGGAIYTLIALLDVSSFREFEKWKKPRIGAFLVIIEMDCARSDCEEREDQRRAAQCE